MTWKLVPCTSSNISPMITQPKVTVAEKFLESKELNFTGTTLVLAVRYDVSKTNTHVE